jgi:hypothetical protein
MWIYEQRTGRMTHDGLLPSRGYSGHGEGYNNPEMESVANVGPIPKGTYTIEAPIEPGGHLGPCALPLVPDSVNQMFGRQGFYIHGDNVHLNHSASDGCIILGPDARHAIKISPDRRLQVV